MFVILIVAAAVIAGFVTVAALGHYSEFQSTALTDIDFAHSHIMTARHVASLLLALY